MIQWQVFFKRDGGWEGGGGLALLLFNFNKLFYSL